MLYSTSLVAELLVINRCSFHNYSRLCWIPKQTTGLCL